MPGLVKLLIMHLVKPFFLVIPENYVAETSADSELPQTITPPQPGCSLNASAPFVPTPAFVLKTVRSVHPGVDGCFRLTTAIPAHSISGDSLSPRFPERLSPYCVPPWWQHAPFCRGALQSLRGPHRRIMLYQYLPLLFTPGLSAGIYNPHFPRTLQNVFACSSGESFHDFLSWSHSHTPCG